ncbi:MAG: PH domain-containing protein [Deltaproteobacteria bacterium]|jgi:hypothetical protein|nr:PH domain-containing protein [Deltaproteobacteria bacterium]
MGELDYNHQWVVQDLVDNHGYMGLWGVFGVGRALSYLPRILTRGEKVLALTRGIINVRPWLLAITDARVILLSRGYVLGLKLLEIPLVSIKMVFHHLSLFFGEIVFHCGDFQTRLGFVNKKELPELMTTLAEAMAARSQPPPEPHSERLANLERLAALLAKGALTEAEFLAQKKKILASR